MKRWLPMIVALTLAAGCGARPAPMPPATTANGVGSEAAGDPAGAPGSLASPAAHQVAPGAPATASGQATEGPHPALAPAGGPFDGLTEAMRSALGREDGCQAAAAWAGANPAFLQALNLGVGTGPWTPELLCRHIDIQDRLPLEDF